ncbi:ubiquinol-cytochrome c reductase iron-sulfur subunit [Paludibaculum fermentans]|uniref:QcrA and Rieske domain-containing protein n=1 Tax=Paludibaculum fermentans TaxID=1473598 RepID=UPI003EBD6A05
MSQQKECPKQRLWSEEFSVRSSESSFVERRQFTRFLTLTSFSMFAGQLWLVVKSVFNRRQSAFPAMVVNGADGLAVGSAKVFQYPTPQDNCLLVRVDEQKFVAYSQKCTHLSCAVLYSARHRRLECPCHEGYFSIEDGRVLQGPPPRPLPKVELERRGSDLVAIGMTTGEES